MSYYHGNSNISDFERGGFCCTFVFGLTKEPESDVFDNYRSETKKNMIQIREFTEKKDHHL